MKPILLLIFLTFQLHAVDDPAVAVFRDNCSACHLDSGIGNASLKVPAIAGLPRWYVSDQLRKFRYGTRGGHKDDTTGHLMKASTINLDERVIAFLGRYVQNLPIKQKRITKETKLENGKQLYEKNCQSCHSVNAVGDKRKRVPPLNIQLDWYLLAQLEKFSKGQRPHAKEKIKLDLETDAKPIVSYLTHLKKEAVKK
jgi:cytochrome c553